MKILIDLERTFLSSKTFYWRQNRHGYTTDISEAGLFPNEAAEQIVKEDIDKRTVAIDQDVVASILKN